MRNGCLDFSSLPVSCFFWILEDDEIALRDTDVRWIDVSNILNANLLPYSTPMKVTAGELKKFIKILQYQVLRF